MRNKTNTELLAGRFFVILSNEGVPPDQSSEWIEAEITNNIGQKGNLSKVFLSFKDEELLRYYRSHEAATDDAD